MSNYLIDFKQTASKQDIDNYLTEQNCTTLKKFQNFDQVVLVSCPVRPASSDLIDNIIEDSPNVVSLLNVDASIIREFSLSEETNWWKAYSLKQVNFDSPTATIKKQGANSIVYILDSGINDQHPDFSTARIEKLYSVLGDLYVDNSGHGTGIASVICGDTCGISLATVKVCKIFDPSHQTLQSELLSAFDVVLQDYAANLGRPGIVNLSWAIPKNVYVENKIKALRDRGLIVVAAAGNSGQPIDDVTPAAMPEVLTVGSYNQDFIPSDFSNYSAWDSATSLTTAATNHGELDGWAPGEKIWVATPNGLYGYVHGTSIAAGITSAILAYNFDVTLVNNQIIKCIDLQSLGHISALSFMRNGMLNLSDPKYTNSVNKIVTIINAQSAYVDPNVFRLAVKVGEIGCRWLYFDVAITNIEILKPLAPGFRIENGWLVGEPTAAIEENYDIHVGQVRLTFTDGSTKEVDVSTAVLRDTFDPNLYPQDDPIIPIALLFICGYDGYGTQSCSTGCSGGCDPGTYCQCADFKNDLCGCV